MSLPGSTLHPRPSSHGLCSPTDLSLGRSETHWWDCLYQHLSFQVVGMAPRMRWPFQSSVMRLQGHRSRFQSQAHASRSLTYVRRVAHSWKTLCAWLGTVGHNLSWRCPHVGRVLPSIQRSHIKGDSLDGVRGRLSVWRMTVFTWQIRPGHVGWEGRRS